MANLRKDLILNIAFVSFSIYGLISSHSGIFSLWGLMVGLGFLEFLWHIHRWLKKSN
jgi:hypothetical protein